MRDGACQCRSRGGNDYDDGQLCFGKRLTLERWHLAADEGGAHTHERWREQSDANEATNKLEPIFTNNNELLRTPVLSVMLGFA